MFKLKRAAALLLSLTLVCTPVWIRAEAEVNLAAGKPVAASLQSDWLSENFPLTGLTDGKTDTMRDVPAIIEWDKNGLAWYEIDFQASVTINQLKFFYHNDEWPNRPLDFVVDAFDGQGWMRIVEQHMKAYDRSDYTYRFRPVACRRIRITASNARSGKENFRLLEVGAYNTAGLQESDYTPLDAAGETGKLPDMARLTNVLAGQKVTASDTNDFTVQNYPLSNLTDGKANIHKDSPGLVVFENQYACIQITPKKPEVISHIRLTYFDDANFFAHRPVDFAVDVWNGKNWTRVVEQHGLKHGSDTSIADYYFDDISCAALRITASIARSKGEMFGFTEVEADGVQGTAAQKAEARKSADSAAFAVPAPAGGQDAPLPYVPRMDAQEGDVCLGRPVTSTTRYEVASFLSNLTDGRHNNQAMTANRGDSEESSGWFQIDLGADVAINHIRYVTVGDGYPIDLAIDVWSGGQWVRVVRKYGLAAGRQDFYFDDIACSYIRLTASRIRQDPFGAAYYKLCEVEAYKETSVDAADKKKAMDDIPSDRADIPAAVPLPENFNVQGDKSDRTLNPELNSALLAAPARQEDETEKEPGNVTVSRRVIHIPMLVLGISLAGLGLIGLVTAPCVWRRHKKKQSGGGG